MKYRDDGGIQPLNAENLHAATANSIDMIRDWLSETSARPIRACMFVGIVNDDKEEDLLCLAGEMTDIRDMMLLVIEKVMSLKGEQ